MNIVFWAIIVIALILVWFLAAPLFKRIGGGAINMADNAANEMKVEDKNNEV